jgi:hypothetical protein
VIKLFKEIKMGSKPERQNQHFRRLMAKIRKFEKQGKSVEKLKKELSYAIGDVERPKFKTGRDADPRLRKRYNS